MGGNLRYHAKDPTPLARSRRMFLHAPLPPVTSSDCRNCWQRPSLAAPFAKDRPNWAGLAEFHSEMAKVLAAKFEVRGVGDHATPFSAAR